MIIGKTIRLGLMAVNALLWAGTGGRNLLSFYSLYQQGSGHFDTAAMLVLLPFALSIAVPLVLYLIGRGIMTLVVAGLSVCAWPLYLMWERGGVGG